VPSREDVLETARLARLALTTDEVERMRHELDGILRHIETIRQVAAGAAPDGAGSAAEHAGAATDAVNAAAGVSAADHSAPLRPDQPGSDSLDMPLSSFAPEWREGFFTVPRLPTHD
jgi:Asp-tRNA(Asn)/Glu-tRNA(Gln) amidotransferase C subunit